MAPTRNDLIKELQELDNQLKVHHNDILIDEFKTTLKILRETIKKRSRYDNLEQKARWKAEQKLWTDRYQAYLDNRDKARLGVNAHPREEPVNFNGRNAKGFWQHFEASIYHNPALNERQKMSHFISRY